MKKFFAVILVFIIAFSIRIYQIHMKSGLHVDEALSYVISARNDYAWRTNFLVNTEYTGEEIQKLVFGNPDGVKDLVSDIGLMYIDNRDHPLTNLYYSALRAAAFNLENYDLKNLIKRGCALNLLFFCVSFFYFYKLLNIILVGKKKKYIPFALFIAFMNTASISATLFLRPYQLQETMLIIMTYIFASFYKDIINDKFNISVKKFIVTAFVIALVTLSGYFSLIYEAVLGSVLLILCYRKRLYNTAGLLVGLFISSIVIANLLYLGFYLGFTSYRAVDVYNSCNDIVYNLKLSISRFIVLLLQFLFYPISLVLSFILMFFARKKVQNNLLWIIVGCSFLCGIVIMILSPYKVLRYIMPLFPILSLSLAHYVQKFNFKITYLYVFIYLWAAVFAVSLDYGAPKPIRVMPFARPIENVYRLQDKQFTYRFNQGSPVYINEGEPWTSVNLFTYLNKTQKYRFVNFSFFERKMYPANSFIIYPKEKSLPFEETFQKIDCSLYYKCFEIKGN